MKKTFLKPQDMRFANRIKRGWKVDRDWNYAYITDGKQQIKIPLACYNRLLIEGLTEN